MPPGGTQADDQLIANGRIEMRDATEAYLARQSRFDSG
jgi:hypothetical protein